MSLWDWLFRSRERMTEDLDQEIHDHIERETEDKISRGMLPEEARHAALRKFGNVTQIKEEMWEVWSLTWLEQLWQDIRFGLRMLVKNPGFTAVSMLTLAVGIGTNTAIFSVVNGVLLKPLPYPHAERLVDVSHSAPKVHVPDMGMSPSMYFVYRQRSRTFEDIGVYYHDSVSVTGLAEPEHVRALEVTDGLLPILGVRPVLGRLFTRSDDSPGSPETVMLSYDYWQSAFGGDSSTLGKTIIVDSKPREIIGVLPRRFRFLDEPDPALILPIKLDQAQTTLGKFGYGGIARLKPGITLAEANADVARMQPIVARSFPAPPRFSRQMYESAGIRPDLRLLREKVVGNVGKVLWLLMGGIGLVLLIACANVANLLLVRVEGRRQELAVRAALGASPRRIARQLLVESVALALPSGGLGLAVAFGGLRILMAMAASALPRLAEIGLDSAVVLFALAASLGASILFGSVPILKYAGLRLGARLREGGRSLSASRERHRARSVLVIAQVGLAFVLLISSGLMIRTYRALVRAQPGFTAPPAGVQTFSVFISSTEVPNLEQVARIQEQILRKIEAIPGVSSAAISTSVPMDGGLVSEPLFVRDHPESQEKLPPIGWFNFVSPGYLNSIGAPLVVGRDFTWDDIYNKLPIVLISENLAREYWHRPADAIGKQIRMGATDEWHEIVGVVGDIHDDGMNKPAPVEVHWPLVTTSFEGIPVISPRDVTIAVRSPRAGSGNFMGEIQRAVWSVDPNLPLADVHTLAYFYRKSMARTSFTLVMLALAGSMALLLGAVGLYGVISSLVAQRTREIGIRAALGARKIDVLRLVVGESMLMALVGVGVGIAGALLLTRFMGGLLYGVQPADPLTFFVVSLVLTFVALLASYIPARRATKVDPMASLRCE